MQRKAKQFSPNEISIELDGDFEDSSAANNTFFAEIDEVRNVMGKLSEDVTSMKLRQRSLLAQTIVDESEKVFFLFTRFCLYVYKYK